MALGVYFHIPYCLQRCTYCDFATYEFSKILPPKDYVQLVLAEMNQKAKYYQPRLLDTIYFGGGTPSLIDPQLILALIQGLEKLGFKTRPNTEMTIEINPATINEDKLKQYLDFGINRFSVGAQTFDNQLLKMVNREHNAQQTLETLELLAKHGLNFSFDILFALPHQTFAGLQKDVDIAIQQGASHISPYCLTVPSGHPLSKNRPPEDEQVDMFDFIREQLVKNGFAQYEISNFSKPGFESRHNLLYWTDQEYWGLGLSAHSYLKNSAYGTRFWNLNNIQNYQDQIRHFEEKIFSSPDQHLPPDQFEILEKHQALTDFCYTSLRTSQGLDLIHLKNKFDQATADLVIQVLKNQIHNDYIKWHNHSVLLTDAGNIASNLVFEKLTFLKSDLS